MPARTFDIIATPVGNCVLVAERGLLTELRFDRRPGEDAGRDPVGMRPYVDAVREYFEGRPFPEVPLDLTWATPFQRSIYGVVRDIPRGRVLEYGEVARLAGCTGGARAVGQAMGANRICLAVP